MNDAISWQAVVLALVSGLPAIIGAAAAYVAATRSGRNTTAIEEVRKTVNGHSTAMQAKLDEALKTIGELTGQPAKTTAEAPSKTSNPT